MLRFYALAGKYEKLDLFLMDAITKTPVELKNDEGMPNVSVHGIWLFSASGCG